MKKAFVAGILMLALAMPCVVFGQVETSMGTLQLGGKVKFLYAYQARDEEAEGASGLGQLYGFDGAPVEQFATTNVEVDVYGTIGEKISYLIELQAANANLAWVSNPNEMGPIGVRQAKIMIANLVPMTTFTVGTFNLPVTVYQHRATNDQDLILLPLLNMMWISGGAYPGTVGNVYAPIGLGWQATGVNVALIPHEVVEVDFAYFNGNAGGAPNVDVDLEKSWLINLKVMPGNAMISVGYMYEGWEEQPGGHQNAAGYIVSAAGEYERFEGNLDWVMMTAQDYQLDDSNDFTELTWTGYQVTLGYWFTDQFEVLGRYEWIDPNTIDDKDAVCGEVTENDQLTWMTIGLNYRMAENAEVSVNYIFSSEQGSDIDVDSLEVGGKYQALDNDLLLVQVQVWQ